MTNSKYTTLGDLEDIGYDWGGDTRNAPRVYNNKKDWGVKFTPETPVYVHKNGAVYYSQPGGNEKTLEYDSVAISDEEWETLNNMSEEEYFNSFIRI